MDREDRAAGRHVLPDAGSSSITQSCSSQPGEPASIDSEDRAQDAPEMPRVSPEGRWTRVRRAGNQRRRRRRTHRLKGPPGYPCRRAFLASSATEVTTQPTSSSFIVAVT